MPFQYDPTKVVPVYYGNILSGFADGAFASAKRNTDKMTAYVGSDGQVTIVKSADDTGEITITLAQSSASNDILTAIANQQEIGPIVSGPFMLKDLLGTTLISAQNAWIKKRPDVEFGKEVSTREWVLGCAKLIMNIGGNL